MKLVLTKTQQMHAENGFRIFTEHKKFLDTSCTGMGKSIIFIWMMIQLKPKNIVMVCPKSMIDTWKNYNKLYKLNFLNVISYECLRGVSTNETSLLKHSFLIRNKDKTFAITDYFRSLVEEGVILCFDESQKMKNSCDQQKSACELNRYIMQRYQMQPPLKTFSGCYFISTTPFDKQEHCLNFLSTSGIILTDAISDPKTKELTGLYQLKSYCSYINLKKTNQIWGTSEISFKQSIKLAYKLTTEIILPSLTSFILADKEDEILAKQSVYYSHSQVPAIAEEIAVLGDKMIHTSVGNNTLNITTELNDKYKEITHGNSLTGRMGITHGQITLHSIKAYYCIIPLAKQALAQIPNCKITIFLDFVETVNIVSRELDKYGVVVITGETKEEDRITLREKIQEPNLDKRILVTMNQVSSIGLEFDDQHGGFPRVGISIAGYNISNMIQATGRISRKKTITNSLFFFVKFLTSNTAVESSVENNITEKSKVFEETLKNNGIIPPSTFENIESPEKYNMLDLINNAGKQVIPEKPVYAKKIINVVRSDISKRDFL